MEEEAQEREDLLADFSPRKGRSVVFARGILKISTIRKWTFSKSMSLKEERSLPGVLRGHVPTISAS